MSMWEEHPLAQRFWRDCRANIPIYEMHGHMGGINTIYFARRSAANVCAHKAPRVNGGVFAPHALFDRRSATSGMGGVPEISGNLRMYVAINHTTGTHPRGIWRNSTRGNPSRRLKFLPDYHATPVDDPKYEYALAFAAERKLPVLCHTWGSSANNGFAQLSRVTQKYPDVTFFIAHSLFGDWEGAERLVRESSGNVYLELTAVPGERGILERLTASVGSERLIFSTTCRGSTHQAVGGGSSARITEKDMPIFLRQRRTNFREEWYGKQMKSYSLYTIREALERDYKERCANRRARCDASNSPGIRRHERGMAEFLAETGLRACGMHVTPRSRRRRKQGVRLRQSARRALRDLQPLRGISGGARRHHRRLSDRRTCRRRQRHDLHLPQSRV